MYRVLFSGCVWESSEARRLGKAKSDRYFNYQRTFDMPSPPAVGLRIMFGPRENIYVRVEIVDVAWHVDLKRYRCSGEDLLLEQLSRPTMAEAVTFFRELRLKVDVHPLAESDLLAAIFGKKYAKTKHSPS